MNRPSLLLASTALSFVAVAGVAKAAEPPSTLPDRLRLVFNGSASFASLSFSDSRQYVEYAETAVVHSSYSVKTRFGPEVALQLKLYRGLGLLVGYSLSSHGETGAFDAQSPHPLYLDRPRSVSGNFAGYSYREGEVQLDLALGRASGRVEWTLFSGVSLFQVQADMLDRPSYSEKYPYDTLTLAATPASRASASPAGFNVGGRLDYRFGRSVGVGVGLRYSTASVKLRANSDASEASINAGGLQAGAGLRLYF